MSSELCRLCFDEPDMPIGIFSAEGIQLDVVEAIRVHLADEANESDNLPKSICQSCWITVKRFHEFYNTVKVARNNYLLNFVKHEESNFLEINCDFIDCDDNFASVKIEQIAGIADSAFEILPLEESAVEDNSEDEIDIFAKEPNEALVKISSDVNVHQKEMIPRKISSDRIPTANETNTIPEPELILLNEHNDVESETDANSECANRVLRSQSELDNIDHSSILNHTVSEPTPNSLHERGICKIRYDLEQKLNDHTEEMHGRRNEPRFKCEYCDETFEKAIRMRFHVKNIHIDKIHKCSHCQKQFTKVDSLRSHIRYHHDRKYKICTCEICGKECMRPEILRGHMTEHTGVGAFKCKYCSQTFRYRATVYNHQKKMHPSCIPSATVTQYVNRHTSKFKCEICLKEFLAKRNFQNHMISKHTPNPPYYECDICKKRLPSRMAAYAHMKKFHEKPSDTDICKSSNSDVTEPKAICELCGKSYKNKNGMLAHVKNMHEKDGKVYECPHCHKQFAKKSVLYGHVNFHHSTKSRKCSFCDKVYKCYDALKEHMTKHTGEDAYKCKYCEDTFKNRYKMYAHQKREHWDEWNADRIARECVK